MNENKKLMSGLKSKLVAAICMLLVAVIMVVSSTYAWFTLSTAPEVTGITTAVGANGALEIALLPLDGDPDKIGTGSYADEWTKKNTTWGNLVNLEGNYGLESITLYPATINGTADAAGNISAFPAGMLKYPTYGSDGRVDQLLSNVATATLDNGTFKVDNNFGVRAVGTSSGLTDRQIAYRDARAKANTAMAQAKTVASNSLTANGGALADIAMKHETADGTDTYKNTDVTSLLAIVNSLYGSSDSKGAFKYIEEAALNYILAFAASKGTPATEGTNQHPDTVYTTVKAMIDQNPTLDAFIAAWQADSTLNTIDILSVIPKLQEIYTLLYDSTEVSNEDTTKKGKMYQLAQAKAELDALTDDEHTWEEISKPMYRLVALNSMTLNGYPISSVRDNLGNIVSSVSGQGLVLEIASGGGVYADIADCCGDYTAFIKLQKVTYGTIVMENLDATMKTKGVNPAYLHTISQTVIAAGSPVAGANADTSITEFYGYIIDLAFRTNAAESDLLLQSDAIDRIYDDNSNDETMGKGASMTFSVGAGVTKEMAINLMSNFRIVFFTPGDTSNSVLATAKLDTSEANITVDSDGKITAYLYLYEYELATDASGNILYDADNDGIAEIKYWYDGTSYYSEAPTGTEGSYTYNAEKKVTDISDAIVEKALTGSDAIITALPQNTATKVSVLVYLEGSTIENADVAASAYQSLTGTLNLQFASSAELIPQEDGNLHTTVTVTEDTIAVGADKTLVFDGATTWSSSDAETISVDNNGKLTVIKATDAGETVTITAKNSAGKIVAQWKYTVTGA